MRRPTLVLAALALVVGACRDGAPASRLDAEPELSGAHSDLTAHLELRIDETLDPGWPLTRVGDVVIGHDGRLFVSQPQVPAVYVLDETGRVTGTIGRQGEGPGEFMGLAALGLLGDTLFASDPDLGRVSFFSPDGEFIRSRQWIADMEPRRVEDGFQLLLLPGPPVALFSGGSALVRPNMMLMPEPPGEEVRRRTLRIPLLKIDAESRVVDTLAWEETTIATVGLRRRGSVFQIAAPFQRHPHTAIMPNGAGVVVARDLESGRASVSVNRIGPGADTLFSRNYTYRPIPVTEADLERSLGDLTVFPPDVDGGPMVPTSCDLCGRLVWFPRRCRRSQASWQGRTDPSGCVARRRRRTGSPGPCWRRTARYEERSACPAASGSSPRWRPSWSPSRKTNWTSRPFCVTA
ncbi:6-bladed beta-propeller [Candidatus Palauibacter sp.]|uniref:6-bladed beta-propeller n=1 Tax=Candidatus Palauibacter sp. TaxID=3101350 RepID=UPI003B02B36D